MKEITIRRPVVWKSVQDTNVGMVREANEDSVLSNAAQLCWAVADGMGGYEGGNVASQMVVAALESLTADKNLSQLVDDIEDRLLDVNHRILEYADIMLDGRTLGSTVVTLAIKGRVGVCMWVGDSRLYRFRNRRLLQLSRDHSQIQEQIQQGYITAETAANSPNANVITRAVGADPELYVDINVFSTQLGDVFLLCSDGLYNMVNEDEIAAALGLPLEQAIDSLMRQALERGADDNVSLILVKGEPGNTKQRHAASAAES